MPEISFHEAAIIERIFHLDERPACTFLLREQAVVSA